MLEHYGLLKGQKHVSEFDQVQPIGPSFENEITRYFAQLFLTEEVGKIHVEFKMLRSAKITVLFSTIQFRAYKDLMKIQKFMEQVELS